MDNKSQNHISQLLKEQGYITDSTVAMSLHLSMLLKKPLLVEGPAGVGKTEIAKVLCRALDTKLIRLQCYEGMDANHAIYEWNYQRQLLYLRMNEHSAQSLQEKEQTIFSDAFLLKRPLLESIQEEKSPVLLIDEIDRTDEAFESYFLELLSDWQITIPEMGTIEAKSIPYVILTGNRTRELSEALRRRCLYLWIDYPTFEKELEIVKTKVPKVNEQMAEQICKFMMALRKKKLEKLPGIAETLDWATALAAMHIEHLDKEVVESTLGVVLKDWQDVRQAQMSLQELFDEVGVTFKAN